MTDLAFMFSNWYSGATLLAILLNSNSRLVCNGETFEFEHGDIRKESYRCSCGQSIPDCPFFRAVAHQFLESETNNYRYFSVLPDVSDSPLRNRVVASFSKLPRLRNFYINSSPTLKTKLDHYLSLHEQFFMNACAHENASCYIDGTKSVRRAELFRLYGHKPFKVIYLVRDGRGFAWSYIRNNSLDKSDLKPAADAWLSYVRQVDTFMERYPSVAVHVTRYEDLCHTPESALRGICEFLDVAYDPSMTATPKEHHVLGNQIRHSFNGTVKESLSWRNQFDKNQIAELELLMKNELKRFSYI